MKKLTKRQLLNSLVFPIITTVWACFKLFFKTILWGFASYGIYEIVCIAAIVIGGILPSILTITLGIETGQYFLQRLFILLSTILIVSVSGEFIDNIPIMEFMLLIVSLVFGALYFKNKTKFSE